MSEKRIALIAAILGSAIVFLDSTIVNVALPAIRASLHGGLSEQQWVVEAYLLTLSSLLLVGGSLGDLLGRRRVFSAGVAGFGACSLLCALAPSAAWLIGARALQGVAGALLVPSTLALIMDTFGEDERAPAIGTWTAWTGVATVIGPLGGGALVQAASWRWIFGVNLLPVAIVLLLLRRLRADTRAPGHVDVLGAVLCALGLGGPVFALIEQPHFGWSDPRVLVPLVGGVILLAAFLAWERRAPAPMLPLALFSIRNFAVGNVTTLAVYGGLGVATFFTVLFLQQVAGYTPIAAGLSLLPITLIMFTLSRRFGALADRLGPHAFMGGGPILAGAGLLLFLRAGASADYPSTVLPAVLVFGVGLAATVAPLTATVLGAVEPGHSGLASGVNNSVARVAGLLAIAALGAVLAASFAGAVDRAVAGRPLTPAAAQAVAQARMRPLVTSAAAVPAPERETVHAALTSASVDAFHRMIGIAAGLVMLGGVISLLGIRNPRRRIRGADCPGGALTPARPELVEAPAAEPVAGRA
ncbi:MAG: MFS transporter [Solirubrobacterales bacterium]|nr:MFS transporter [Solirubrobacterales bacterium]MBV9714644.1 MFS transporter [Solirubrobacterales bacterium]